MGGAGVTQLYELRSIMLLISYIGMCCPIGWGRIGYTLPILVWNPVWVSREQHGVSTYLSFQFQMSKKERELCEFEMDLNNLFLFAL